MPAEHHHDAPGPSGSVGDRANDGAEVTCNEDVRERVEERAEGAVLAGWLREVAGADLVGTDGDRNRAHGREIRLGRSGRRV